MRKTARAGALVIVPIGLAVQAHAAVLFPDNATCTINTSCFSTQLGAQNGVEGLSLQVFNSGFGASSSGGNGESVNLSIDANGLLTLDSSGSTCNGVGQPCSLGLFQLSFGAEMQPESGQNGQPLQSIITSFDGVGLGISLNGTQLFSEFVPASSNFSEGVGGTVTVPIPVGFQSDVASLVSGSSGTDFDLRVVVSFGYSTNGPGNSLVDAGANLSISALPAPTPEPATTGLALSGLLGLGAWLRRRRRA